jgi:endonuclease/exonuclease/phosphatase family metal-dependent hydrolase
MRNKQIQAFFTDFWFHKRKQRNDTDKVIVLGDFNTTPRSPYYQAFADGFSAGTFLNITRILPYVFTRKSL